MKYRFGLRSLMFVGLVGPPVLASAIVLARDYAAATINVSLVVAAIALAWWLNERRFS